MQSANISTEFDHSSYKQQVELAHHYTPYSAFKINQNLAYPQELPSQITTQTRSRGYAKFRGQDDNENTSPLPALAKVTTKEDCEKMTPTDAWLHFKTRVYPLVNKLRKYKNKKGCDRTLTDLNKRGNLNLRSNMKMKLMTTTWN